MGFDKLNLLRPVSSQQELAGADCSGSKETPNETWLALASLNGMNLEINQIRKVGMHALSKELNSISDLAAVGLDCPFSLPVEFMNYLSQETGKAEFQNWQELAEEVVFMPFERFQELAKAFKKEAKRITDKQSCAQALSPLHRGYPSMLQMTYHGIRMLAGLNPDKFHILPFQDKRATSAAVIEVYPRAILKCLGLADTGYKSKEKKDREKMQSARHKLLSGLTSASKQFKNCPNLVLGSKVMQQCVDSDHALDALLAAYGTAIWLNEPGHCSDPFAANEADVLLEGWIYEPLSLV